MNKCFQPKTREDGLCDFCDEPTPATKYIRYNMDDDDYIATVCDKHHDELNEMAEIWLEMPVCPEVTTQ